VPPNAPNRFKTLYERVYRMADNLICHSEGARLEVIRDFGVSEEKTSVIPHGPLFDEKPKVSPTEARTKLQLPADENIVLYLGVINEYKGIPFLLDAWKRAIQAGVRGRLIIAGTGDTTSISVVRDKISREGIEASVNLRLEFISVEQLPLFYHAADILVYPYKAGTTSGALLTGLNYGKAVIATSLPVFSEHLKHAEEALLVNYGDVNALAESLVRLIRDPLMREQLGHAAIKRKGELGHSWEKIARLTIDCYQEVCGKGT
jgi:glycosyltransferase involved in cell wall biosynthesis